MIKRWKRSRVWRKFKRSRLAVGALFVVGLYLLVALFVFLGAITVEDTQRRYGPDELPGFYRLPDAETRLANVTSDLNEIDRALSKRNVRAALDQIEIGGYYHIADKSPTELKAQVDVCWLIVREFDAIDDLDEDPNTIKRIADLEVEHRKLITELEGSEKFIQNFAEFAGTDMQGRSILIRAIYSIKVAMQIGVVTALVSVLIGTILGSAAGYFGGWVDHFVIWLYSTISSIPNLVLLVLLAYVFRGSAVDNTLVPVYVAFCATFWVGPCRVIRGETMKLKELEYVQAAKTVGFNGFYILGRHLIPNMSHLMLINFSLLLIGAIKSEVILSYLGLGVKSGASWGIMIKDSEFDVINGFVWQIGTATFFMFILVLAFNILSDALQDVFDPKHN